jgi:hypothetical protein
MEVNRMTSEGVVRPRLIAVLALLGLASCGMGITARYLDPRGVGTTQTVGNPCPYTYRVMEIRSTKDPDLRISVSAFWKGEYQLKNTTLFVVVSDRGLFAPAVVRFVSRPLSHSRSIAFPSGTSVTIHDLQSGDTVATLSDAKNGSIIHDQLILTVPIANDFPDQFSVTFPDIEVDGEKMQLGTVMFTRTVETLYFSAC